MRIGIDGIVLRGRDAGTLRYMEELLAALALYGTSHDYRIFGDDRVFRPEAMPSAANLAYQHVHPSRILPRALSQQLYRSWHALGKLDLLHCPAFVPPLAFDGKTVATIFDLTFVLYPETQKWTGRMWWRILGPRGMAKADRLIALSESTKADLVKTRLVPDEKIRVVYPCTRESFRPTPSQQMRAKYHLPDQYVLYVGTLERRKNLSNLIRAFDKARRMGQFDHALVLAGQRGWLYEDLFRTVEELGLGDRILFLGYVPDQDLPGLYSGADLFVYLSKYEGFGLPVLEAMACGVPVLSSNSSSLPEVAGDAAVLVPPEDIDLAAREMKRILSDRDLRQEMANKGLHRATCFTRARLARETIAVYEEVVR